MVEPRDVDKVSGSITRADRARGRPGSRLGVLNIGDILIPAVGEGPCVLVSEEHEGLTFSTAFHTIRPADGHSVALWALLSSTAGVVARQNLLRGSSTVRLSVRELADMVLPFPPARVTSTLSSLLPKPAVHPSVGVGLQSTWVIRSLEGTDDWWRVPRATSVAAEKTVRLESIAEIWAGTVHDADAFPVEHAGLVPLMTRREVRSLAGPRLWAVAPENALRTTDATVILTTDASFRAALAPANCLVEDRLVAISVRDAISLGARRAAHRLTAFLAGARGQLVLEDAAVGATSRHLSLKALRSLEVPDPADLPDLEGAGGSLSIRIDAALETS